MSTAVRCPGYLILLPLVSTREPEQTNWYVPSTWCMYEICYIAPASTAKKVPDCCQLQSATKGRRAVIYVSRWTRCKTTDFGWLFVMLVNQAQGHRVHACVTVHTSRQNIRTRQGFLSSHHHYPPACDNVIHPLHTYSALVTGRDDRSSVGSSQPSIATAVQLFLHLRSTVLLEFVPHPALH